MINSISSNSNCSGCGVCEIVCPKHAVSFKRDVKGFIRPVVNDDCIDCGLCVKKCHEHKSFSGDKILSAYMSYTNNVDIRNASSSGGVFSELAIKIIEKGGFVCGAGFDNDFVLCHQIVESVEELGGLRKSKYLESNVKRILKELKERVAVNNQKGMFVGTPCQCAAVRSYLGDYSKNLLICDFVCHGVASPLVFDKYKAYLQSHYGSPIKIEFRHKNNGEGSYFYYEGTTGVYMVPNYSESYPYAYADGSIIADDCTDCKYCSLERFSDITLGDYVSGPADYSKSTIFVNTEKGMDFLNECKSLVAVKENLHNVIAKSWHLTTPNTYNPKREKVFAQLDREWEYLDKKYFHQPNKMEQYRQLIYNKIKKIFKK